MIQKKIMKVIELKKLRRLNLTQLLSINVFVSIYSIAQEKVLLALQWS